jgi:aspartate kinase
MTIRVCKSGGTSVSKIDQIGKSIDIILADDSRKYWVVSAPAGMTNLLIDTYNSSQAGNYSRVGLYTIMKKLVDIAPNKTHLLLSLEESLNQRVENRAACNYEDLIKAFGEEGNARIIASILNDRGVKAKFVDPKEIGFLVSRKNGVAMPDPSCYAEMGRKLKELEKQFRVLVIPGFYAYDRTGMLFTLPRGGSDTSGSVIARAVMADIYENWTDVDGLKEADPRIVPYARTISKITRREARELAYMKFKLQDRCFEPLIGTRIILNIKNTNNPNHPGTMVVESREVDPKERIVGVACVKDNVSIDTVKFYIEDDIGYGRTLLEQIEKAGISYEHTPDGVDSTSVVLDNKRLQGKTSIEQLVKNIQVAVNPDEIATTPIAIMALAGLGMRNHYDTEARTLSVLADRRIQNIMLDKGSRSLSFALGVEPERADEAVRAVYDEFFVKKPFHKRLKKASSAFFQRLFP